MAAVPGRDDETRGARDRDNAAMQVTRWLTQRRLMIVGALIMVLGFAASMRFQGLNWDDGQHLHPDERFLAIVGDKIRFPSNPLTYFDTKTSPLNPYNARD